MVGTCLISNLILKLPFELIFKIIGYLQAIFFTRLACLPPSNGVFMKALNDKESLALCLFDLAQAYNRNFPDNDGEFVLKAVNRAIDTIDSYCK